LIGYFEAMFSIGHYFGCLFAFIAIHRKSFYLFTKADFLWECKKIRWTDLGLVKEANYQYKQLDERICVLFLLNLKCKYVHFFSSNTT
jgi:hypothetical protein